MRPSPTMQLTLKLLRLSGIAESLEVRLDQARESSLGYLEFLQLILQDEVERRHAHGVQRRLKQAAFQEHKAIEEFDFTALPGVNPKAVKDLAAGLFIDRKEHVILYGPPGTGKTHLAQALGSQACRIGHTTLFITAVKLFRKLATARVEGAFEETVKSFLKPQLLIIDDIILQAILCLPEGQTLQFMILVPKKNFTTRKTLRLQMVFRWDWAIILHSCHRKLTSCIHPK